MNDPPTTDGGEGSEQLRLLWWTDVHVPLNITLTAADPDPTDTLTYMITRG